MKNKILIDGKHYSEDDLVDYKVASSITGLSERTIQDMSSRRELPMYQIGSRSNRYRVGDLLDWREQRKVGG